MCMICADVIREKMTVREAVSAMTELKEEDPHGQEVMDVIYGKFDADEIIDVIMDLNRKGAEYERNKNS